MRKLITPFLLAACSCFFIDPSLGQAPSDKSRQERLIESVGLPEFDPETNTINTVSPQDKQFAKEIMPAMKLVGDTKDIQKNQEALSAIDKLLEKHPEWADGYFLRATLSILVGDKDYKKPFADVESAIKLRPLQKYKSAYETDAEILSLRAKLNMLSGNYRQAMNDLDMAIKIDPTYPFLNTGGVKPEDDSNPTALQKKDFDVLVAKYPDDYRAYMYRGLFYSSFSFYDERNYAPSIDNLKRALDLAPNSALVNYFIGVVIGKRGRWSKAAASDISDLTGAKGGYKQRSNEQALVYLEEATRLDPQFTKAFEEAASTSFKIQQYAACISYYDTVVKLDPNNSGAFHDRGLCKQNTNDLYGAIDDFSKAIEMSTTTNRAYLDLLHESRANAYVKMGNYDKAIQDYGRAIGYKLSSQLFLMTVSHIRGIYPELNAIAEDDLMEGIRLKYFSNITHDDYFSYYKKKTESMKDFVLSGLYVSRGDAYFGKGDWKAAFTEYARALHSSSKNPLENTVDRWKVIHTSRNDVEYSIDIKTIDFSKPHVVTLWLKSVRTDSLRYIQTNYRIDCRIKSIKALSAERFDSDGRSLGPVPGRKLTTIAPDSIEEVLYHGACNS